MNPRTTTNPRSSLGRGARAALLAGVLLLAGAGVIFNQAAGAREQQQEVRAKDLKLKVDAEPIRQDAEPRASFAPVIKGVSASVVNVFTSTKPKWVEGGPTPFGMHPLFRDFFGEGGEGRGFRTPRQEGLGSGVILTEDGFILTNNHVVDGADAIKVALNPDGKEYDAKVVGRDPKSDLAVIKIDAEGLPAIVVGDSDRVEVGDVVLAVGNPFGVGQTVTMGIVGATSREVFGRPMGLEYEDFIQTDAAINPGNSGGALVDARGRLIGINTAILSRSGGNNGVGFAVPVNLARSVMESIVEHGRVIRGFLGVNIQNVTPAMAREFGLKEANGAIVADVTPKSPAEKAGIEPGDVVTRFDGRDVRDSRHLKLMVGQTTPEKEVSVALLRDGKPKTVSVVLREVPEDGRMAGVRRGGRGEDRNPADVGGLQGVVVGDLTPALRRQYGIPRDVAGAVITEVEEDSAAWKAGLRPGDVVRDINKRHVEDAESVVDLAQSLEHSRILLRVWREGGNRFVVVDESKS
ncbi:MAG: Do family serine endopeptidase [Verrucomicrobiales bacterium]|nr:Do family serine endopeptidase [Verrucomicrobiales bacterium]